ncbi:MAG: hypothetical protein KatS3mg109_1991 [Pirellulaceae bacterium]|nr:MAG: hypothetical protein KatS3mg109_1991 [Pirellulaceae bacterium]
MGSRKHKSYLFLQLTSALFLLLIVWPDAARGGSSSWLQDSGHLVVVGRVDLAPTSPQVGQHITVTFRLRNETKSTVTIRRLLAGARGPNACARNWDAPHADFPAVENLTLRPGQEYVYRQSRIITTAGDYFVEPVMQDTQGRWGGIRPFPRVWFNVADADGHAPPPECLIVLEGLRLSQTSARAGQEVEATFKLRNNSQETIRIQRLVAAVRGPDGPSKGWSAPSADFPAATNLTLAPGQEYVYRQKRTFGRGGAYFVEPAYLSADGEWGGIWPWPRVEFTVNPVDPAAVRPPMPGNYCWNMDGDIQGPTEPPAPFLYQPFAGQLSESTWTSQMDHDQPTYRQDGRIATLGELLRYDTQGPGLTGGTESGTLVNGRWRTSRFPRTLSYENILKRGYKILAYQSPSFETYLYYDGHDGNDFAVAGNALAAADGIVAFMGTYNNTLGRVIELYHPQGYLTRYAHLGGYAEGLRVGKSVKAGQPIGAIGGSAVVNGRLIDDYWGTHLHFSVFRWNEERGQWQITDPFGWDPWAGPDRRRRLERQREDPLVRCNGEVSYPLWVGEWPQPYAPGGQVREAEPFFPTQDRYVGGWVGEELDRPSTAERAAHEPLHPDWTSYTNANYVTDLLVDGDAVWAATAGGVVRWDVGTGEYIKLTTEHGLASNWVWAIAVGPDGSLWFSTGHPITISGKGVSRLLPDGRWQTYTTDDGLASNWVKAIAVGPDGSLWFGTPDGVSRLTPEGRWQTYTTDDGLAGNDVRAIAVGPDGSLWFGTDGGVSRLLPDGRWQTYTTDDGLASNWVQTIAVGPDGSLWFDTLGGGVSRLSSDGRWQTFTTDDGLASNVVLAIAVGPDGSLWFGTWGDGVSRLLPDGRWQTYTTDDGLASNDVRAIAVGPDGSLWFGTDGGGVSRYRPQ